MGHPPINDEPRCRQVADASSSGTIGELSLLGGLCLPATHSIILQWCEVHSRLRPNGRRWRQETSSIDDIRHDLRPLNPWTDNRAARQQHCAVEPERSSPERLPDVQPTLIAESAAGPLPPGW